MREPSALDDVLPVDPPEALTAEPEAGWWRCLRAAPETGEGIAARQQLIAHYLPYARMIAATLYRTRYHDEIEFADYLQLASVGLIEAIDRFDPARGVQFRSFAAWRMRGAVLNGLDAQTEKQQQIAVRRRMREERLASLKQHAGAETPDHIFRRLAEIGIGLALTCLLDGTGMIEADPNASAEPYYRGMEFVQLRTRLLGLLGALPQREQQVIRYHYLQETPFVQIAAMLGITKGRVAQLHHQALRRLADALHNMPACDVTW